MKIGFLILGFAMMISDAIHSQNTLDSGLIAKYNFTSNFLDESENAFVAIPHNVEFSIDRFGRTNAAAYFNGVNAFLETEAQFPDGANPKSYSLWISVNQFKRQWIIAGGTDLDGKAFGLFMNDVNDPDLLFHGNGAFYDMTFGPLVPIQKWVHVCVTYGDGIIKGYINSELISTKHAILDTWISQILIGERQNMKANSYFHGSIDDVRIYSRILQEDEINALFIELPTADNPLISVVEDCKVYPNPAVNLMFLKLINFRSATGFKIVNAIGKEVKTSNAIREFETIQLDDLTNGLYIICIFGKDKQIICSNKFIIQK